MTACPVFLSFPFLSEPVRSPSPLKDNYCNDFDGYDCGGPAAGTCKFSGDKMY